jgi:hypothetical protein
MYASSGQQQAAGRGPAATRPSPHRATRVDVGRVHVSRDVRGCALTSAHAARGMRAPSTTPAGARLGGREGTHFARNRALCIVNDWRGQAFVIGPSGRHSTMSTVIAGIEVPETTAAAAAARFARAHTSPLIFDHSSRVYFFGALRADDLGLRPDPELLYVASMMHDTGLFTPFSRTVQRFELDGADHARQLMLQHGFGQAEADVVWTAIALHTTPGVPGRMGPEIAATNVGVLVDAVGLSLDELDSDQVAEITAVHPRADFKNGFLQTFLDGLAHRPDTTYGTVNADVLAHFVPGFRRGDMVDRVMSSVWAD